MRDLQAECASAGVAEVTGKNLAALRGAVKELRMVCAHDIARPHLANAPAVLDTLLLMVGDGSEALPPPSWEMLGQRLSDGAAQRHGREEIIAETPARLSGELAERRESEGKGEEAAVRSFRFSDAGTMAHSSRAPVAAKTLAKLPLEIAASGALSELSTEASSRSAAVETTPLMAWPCLADVLGPPKESAMIKNVTPESFPPVPQLWTGLTSQDVLRQLDNELGNAPRICILGGVACQSVETENLVKAIAPRLYEGLGAKAVFITSGFPGVQKLFARHCGEGSRLWNLLTDDQDCNYGIGTNIRLRSTSLQHQRELYASLGDVYIAVEGGPAVSEEARAALAAGAQVVPLARAGGASSGLFGFPAQALERPPFVSAEQWSILSCSDTPLTEAAAVVASVVAGYASLRRTRRPKFT